jgi:hypothetical protein
MPRTRVQRLRIGKSPSLLQQGCNRWQLDRLAHAAQAYAAQAYAAQAYAAQAYAAQAYAAQAYAAQAYAAQAYAAQAYGGTPSASRLRASPSVGLRMPSHRWLPAAASQR